MHHFGNSRGDEFAVGNRQFFGVPGKGVGIGAATLHKHGDGPFEPILDRLLRIAGPVAAHQVIVERGVVAGVSEDDGANGAVFATDNQHRHVGIDDVRILRIAGASPVDRQSRQALRKAELRGTNILYRLPNQLDELFFEACGVACNRSAIGIGQRVCGRKRVADHRRAVGVGSIEEQQSAWDAILLFHARGHAIGEIARESEQIRGDQDRGRAVFAA